MTKNELHPSISPWEQPVIINVGIELFFQSLKEQSAGVVQVNWTPPSSPNEEIRSILDELL